MTSDACLRAYFNQFSKLRVCVHTSLCSIIDLLLSKVYSIGSSTVIMCLCLYSLINSINEVSVVDLPEPTDQVTRTSQFFLFVKFNTSFGNPKSPKLGNLFAIGLNTTQSHFFSEKTFTLNLE
jgi:hypothetical protein